MEKLFVLALAGTVSALMLGAPAASALNQPGLGTPRGDDRAIEQRVVSETACPAQTIYPEAADHYKAYAVVRKPPGKGPFPAVIFFPGGFGPREVERIRGTALENANLLRFLAAGYVVVSGTERLPRENAQSPTAVMDGEAIINSIKQMPEVDPRSVVVWGASGGGNLALELASRNSLCAIAVDEPATIIFMGIWHREDVSKEKGSNVETRGALRRPFTEELRQQTRRKIETISCPIFFAQGDHATETTRNNREKFIPELKRANKTLVEIVYPGVPHCFSEAGANKGDPAMALKFFHDADAFFRKYLQTQPVPLDESLIAETAVKGR